MLVFAAIVLQRFARRRHLHNLFWGIGLVMFAIGTFAEGYLWLAWNSALFRSWYVFGAMLNAAWLGQGTLNLLVRRRWVHVLSLILVVGSLLAVAAVFTLPLDSAAYKTGVAISSQYKPILPGGSPVRILTPLFNIYGSIFLIGGAVYSSYLFWRKQTQPQRVAGNMLIAAGALVVASAGTLTLLFFGGLQTVAELISAVLMFAGFMVATAPTAATADARTGAVAG